MNQGDKEDLLNESGRDEWLGERRYSDRRRTPFGASEVMRRLMRGLSEKVPGWEQQVIFSRWAEMVGGGERASLSTPVALQEDGTLLVQTEHYAIRTELQFAQEEIVRRINLMVGRPVVRRIAFAAGSKTPRL